MLEKELSNNFTHSVKKRFMELGFPSSTSGELSELILPIKVDATEKRVLSRCDNFFYLEQIVKPYQEEIHNIVQKCWGDDFVFEIDNNLKGKKIAPPLHKDSVQLNSQSPSIPLSPVQNLIPNTSGLPRLLIFESFIAGHFNSEAFDACRYVIEKKDNFGKLLFLYGQTGLGKTHLLHATGQAFQQKYENTKIAYLSAPDFISEVIQKGLKLGKMEEVRNRYKFCDLLLVDDFDVLEKKSVCQAEFLHILNSVLQRKKHVILAAHHSPKEFKHLSSRLKSRLLQGIIVKIHMPYLKDRIKILKEKSAQHNLELSEFQIECLANAVDANVSELDGLLLDISFQVDRQSNAAVSKQNQFTDVVYKRMQSHICTQKQRLTRLQKTVCEYFEIELNDLKGTVRTHKITLARHLAIYIAKSFLNLKTAEILNAFNRKHTKIISYSLKRIEHLTQENFEIKTHLENIKNNIS